MMNLITRYIIVFLVSITYASIAAHQPLESVQQVNALKLSLKRHKVEPVCVTLSAAIIKCLGSTATQLAAAQSAFYASPAATPTILIGGVAGIVATGRMGGTAERDPNMRNTHADD